MQNKVENRYILSLAQDGCWLGGKRKATSQAPISEQHGPGSDHWEWSDGKPWEYNNWASGEPNNWDGKENRVEMWNCGSWNDCHEKNKQSAVYKRNVIVTTK